MRRSAGLLLHRPAATGRKAETPGTAGTTATAGTEVLIGHMGGPYWARKVQGAWSIPKGEHGDDEDALAAARREFAEELGVPAPDGPARPLGSVRQAGGKVVTVWAVQADLDLTLVVPGTFVLEWPPRSGVLCEFPELDRVAWTPLDRARGLVVKGQLVFLDRLEDSLSTTAVD